MDKETLKNGLTRAQVAKAREIFGQVSLRKLCMDNEIPLAVVNNVLRDQSSRIDMLKRALDAATEIIQARKKLLSEIPGQ